MYQDYYAVIMAGGSGTRLWPLSRKDRPKQSLTLVGSRTLFQQAVDRLQGLFSFERILVVTIADQVEALREACPEIPEDNFLVEPMPRGTASVVGLAAIALMKRHSGSTMAILTADHLIGNDAHLRQLLQAAYDVSREGHLVTLGISPTFASTGYGYIQKGAPMGEFQGLSVYQVEKFKEKPDLAQAEEMVSDGAHVWNSGMFIWQVDSVMAEIKRQMPGLSDQLHTILNSWGSETQAQTLAAIWPGIDPQTIDYGIMENAKNVAVIPSEDLQWNDVGSWESLFEALGTDDDGNIILQGSQMTFDTQGTLICEDSADRMIVTVGVKDLIIIDSGNALLVCDRKHAQRVRDIVNKLKETGRDEFL